MSSELTALRSEEHRPGAAGAGLELGGAEPEELDQSCRHQEQRRDILGMLILQLLPVMLPSWPAWLTDLTVDRSQMPLFFQMLLTDTLGMQDKGFLDQLRDRRAQRSQHRPSAAEYNAPSTTLIPVLPFPS